MRTDGNGVVVLMGKGRIENAKRDKKKLQR